ncbi:Zinc finger C2H2-type [Sesbania bispinosa]|nr:Zinc finger C2H2-type [Sesbania bispinosa]
MREAVCLDLMDQYQVGRPPVKLHQGCLSHAPFKMRLAVCSPVSCSCHKINVIFKLQKKGPPDSSPSTASGKTFTCPVENCNLEFLFQSNLKRHKSAWERFSDLHQSYKSMKIFIVKIVNLLHQGKTLTCPVENYNLEFSLQSNLKRHVNEFHDENSNPSNVESQKQYVCPEIGCGKVFRFASKLQKHEDSHVKLESVDVVCLEPGCMKHFTNAQALEPMLTPAINISSEAFQCELRVVAAHSQKSNLNKHEKAVHFKEKPFVCGFPDCGMRFAYKHVKAKGREEENVSPTVEMLVRKRVTPPSQLEKLVCSCRIVTKDALSFVCASTLPLIVGKVMISSRVIVCEDKSRWILGMLPGENMVLHILTVWWAWRWRNNLVLDQ